MDSGNMTETLGETTQPDEVVVTESEATEATPQAEATEEAEFYVEVEGDQQEQPNKMDERQTRAAWLEEKNKRKKKAKELELVQEENKKLKERLDNLESTVSNVTKGERPDPYDYSTKEEFYAALDEWQGHGKKTEPEPASQKSTDNQKPIVQLSDDQEWHLHQAELKMKKALPDYEDAKKEVEIELKRVFSLPNDYPIMDQLAQFAHTYGVDPAKAFYALKKMPDKAQSLFQHATNPAMIGSILRELESKVKVREKKPIESKPEPNIKGGGPVNVLQKEVDNAMKTWKENPTAGNHRILQAARKRLKANNNG